MHWSWFDAAFPWIGGAAAGVLLVALLGTKSFRDGQSASRWHDPVWLSWAAVVAYLLHNVEEYGLDLEGHALAFPDVLCQNFKFPPFPNCPIPPAFFLSVNIPLFWIVGPLAALLAPRHRLVGLALYGVISINGLIHVAGAFVIGYNAGLLTALLLFLPFTVWGGRALFGKERLSYRALALVIGAGVMLHVVLASSVILFVNRLIGPTTLVLTQIVNAVLLPLALWVAEQWHGGVLTRPVPA
jgi:hypothetical protein